VIAAAQRIAILLFDGCDLLDVGGPYEVVLTANRLAARDGAPPPFDLLTVSHAAAAVTAYGGLGLHPTHASAEVRELDVVVIPGTIDIDAAVRDATLVADVRALTERARIVTSVCTGSFLLAAAGALHGRPATTHHEDLAALGARHDVGTTVAGRRFVDDGDVVTAAGLSSGLSLGLHLVDRIAGRDLAAATARQLEHSWDPDGTDVVA
jgi:transcriptional regulator GlxA family with amidase domain